MARLTQAVFVNLGDSPPEPESDVVILVDDSGSMAPFADGVRVALQEFAGKLPAGTRVGLASFGTELRVLCRPTSCAEFLADQAGRFKAESGGTALFDAIGDAVAMFEDSGRLRALVVLTDCDEMGSNRFDHGRLLATLLGRSVRLMVIRFGEKVEPSLETLANTTGGRSLRGSTWAEVERALQEIRPSVLRGPVSLRAEYDRLAVLRQSLPAPWLSLLSLDSWGGRNVTALDSSHLRYPEEFEKHAEVFESIRTELTRLLTDQLRASSRTATDLSDSDVTLFITGWANDRAFLLLSPVVAEWYRKLAESLNITRTIHTIYVPLVSELASLGKEDQALCWAWLSAVHNSGGPSLPKAVLACGNGNRHSSLNPRGFHAETREVVVREAANLLWTLSDGPTLVSILSAGPLLKVGGAASLAVPSRDLERRRAFEILKRRVDAFSNPENSPDRTFSDQARGDVDSWELRLHALIESLAEPLHERIGEVRLDPTDFWPPPAGADRDTYTAELIGLLEERGAGRQARRLGYLINTIRARARKILAEATAKISLKIDATLFRRESADVATTLEYLRRLRAELEEETRKLAPNIFAKEIAQAGLFRPSTVGMGTATVTPEVALDRVRDLIENRPLPEAIALRHVSLALLAGGAAFLSSRNIPGLLFDVGSLPLPWVAGGLTAAAMVALGRYRWLRYRSLLWKSISEYTLALENRAFARAVQECTERVRETYSAVCAWIGDKTEAPAWVPPEVRSEDNLTEMQLVAGFGAFLAAVFERMGKGTPYDEDAGNPFVLEFGRKVPDFSERPMRERQIPDGLAGLSLDWAALGSSVPAWHDRWRECLRRKRCDSLEEYLDFHARRVASPGELHAAAARLLSSTAHGTGTVASLWPSCDDPTRRAIVAELERRSFPPVALDERVAAPVTITDYAIADPQVLAEIRRAIAGAIEPSDDRGGQSISEVDRIHRFRLDGAVGSVPHLVDWAACQTSWNRLEPQQQMDLLARWRGCGDPTEWVDHGSGDRIFPPPTCDESRDAAAEGSLI